jgi:hypothetical protein
MLRRVALLRTDVLEERIASIITVVGIGKLATFLISMLLLLFTANVVPSSIILITLMMGATRFTETSVLTRATQRIIQEPQIFREFCTLLHILRLVTSQADSARGHEISTQFWFLPTTPIS